MVVSIDNAEWPVRLTRRFPAGTPESEVVRTLESEGFTVDRVARTAKADWTGGFCNHDVDAVWTVGDDQKITSISGRYFPTCP